jgi:hypothetical protein
VHLNQTYCSVIDINEANAGIGEVRNGRLHDLTFCSHCKAFISVSRVKNHQYSSSHILATQDSPAGEAKRLELDRVWAA